jgi:16S rRNA (guanine966-N2)-methyltransferase
MRVSSGRYKGREIEYPRAGLRPTKAITRQAMFNIVGPRVRGAKACDLYAGGGSLGIEALSRGAASAVFVEEQATLIRFLRHNVRGLDQASVIRGDVLRVLGKKLARAGFDLVFADPPYMHGLVQATIDRAAEFDVLAPGALFVAEHHQRETPSPPAGWEAIKQGTYGDTMVSVLRRRA